MKTRTRQQAWMVGLLMTGAAALAQAPASGTPAGPAAQPGYGAGYQVRQATERPASAPQGVGPGAQVRRMAAAGADVTPGWTLMTPAEREQHRARVMATTTYQACTTVMTQHREQMAARAKEQGKTLRNPRRDACAALER